jgi:hypothetical protein
LKNKNDALHNLQETKQKQTTTIHISLSHHHQQLKALSHFALIFDGNVSSS